MLFRSETRKGHPIVLSVELVLSACAMNGREANLASMGINVVSITLALMRHHQCNQGIVAMLNMLGAVIVQRLMRLLRRGGPQP